MVDQNQNNSPLRKIEEKLKRQLENSPETLEKVCTFLAKKENSNCLQILESVVDIDEVFQGIVDRLEKKLNNPEAEKVPDIPLFDRLRNADGSKSVVADCSSKSENVSQSWVSAETVTRIGGEISGALIGTAILPGVGTVFGGILGGKLTTSLAGMFSS